MKVLSKILLGFLVAVVAFQVADAAGEEGSSGIVKIVTTVAKLPGKVVKTAIKIQFNTFVKLPFTLISTLARTIVKVIGKVEGLSAEAVSEIIKLIKQIISQIVDVLVEIGVLQGKTIEQVINSVMKILMSVVELFVKSEMKISSSIVESIEKILSGLNIKGIIKKIANLPFVRVIVKLVKDIRSFILNNFKKQIDDVKKLIKSQVEKHKDFFEPIFNGISSRILIISNAMHAVVNGNLQACLGETNPTSSPSGSLKWELNILIDKIRINVLKVMGFRKRAGEIQEKLEIISTPAPSSAAGQTSLPPIMASLAASSASTTSKPEDEMTTEAAQIPKTDTPEDPTDAKAPSNEMMPTGAPPEPIMPTGATPEPIMPTGANPEPTMPTAATPEPVMPTGATPEPIMPRASNEPTTTEAFSEEMEEEELVPVPGESKEVPSYDVSSEEMV